MKQKISGKFLLIFSCCSISVAGIVWACGDGGYYEGENSSFAPEAFVDQKYSPFFYTSDFAYYGDNDVDNNARYNKMVVAEWYDWLDKKVDSAAIGQLFIKASAGAADSVYRYYKGNLNTLPAGMPDVKKYSIEPKKMHAFLSCLLLAKTCESYAVNDVVNYWTAEDKPKAKAVPAALEHTILKAISTTGDLFIKERLWFQMVRYYYYQQKQDAGTYTAPALDLPAYFAKEEGQFPKNLLYYRAMGYVAGYYYQQKEFAKANYLYSLCYDYSFEMKIPSKWSFHPQNEGDWNGALQLAKNNAEKITLWHLLGTSQDEARAIKEIYALDPKSDKLDLLLSRLINIREQYGMPSYSNEESQEKKLSLKKELLIVDQIATEGKTLKPFYWNLAAGYLHSLAHEYTQAAGFYSKAKKQLPKNDQLVMAQYKLLDWTLYLQQLTKIDAKAEAKMVEPLNWLWRLSNNKETVPNLRYYQAVRESLKRLSVLYKKQGELVKANCFDQDPAFYVSNVRIEALKTLMNKANKTPFEMIMLNYYPVTMEELHYLQAVKCVYQEKTDEAVVMMKKADSLNTRLLLANPFSMRMNDCHDCDHANPGKTRYTALKFVETLNTIKQQLLAGKDISRNAALLANAYYNITHYGNGRVFYQSGITGSMTDVQDGFDGPFKTTFTSNQTALKYYLLARQHAATKELKAKYTFMASKCDHNEQYNSRYAAPENKGKYSWQLDDEIPAGGQYFAELKANYAQTAYYKEVLRECGYFNTYLNKKR